MRLKYLLLVCVLFGNLGFANDKDNGGDACERRFKEIRDDIDSWILKDGPRGLTLPDDISLKGYKTKMRAEITDAEISCNDEVIKIGRAEKTCKNFVDNQGVSRIVCNNNRFMNTSETDQYALVHHEYAGLAGFEVNSGEDSDYVLSNQISAFLEDVVVKKLAIKPKNSSKNCNNPGAFGTNFCKIQGGTYTMGSPGNEKDRDTDETQRTVTVGSFEMTDSEVTQKQWQEIMGTNPSYFKSENSPVESVSFNDVMSFIGKLNTKYSSSGYIYRLPSEEEWEYAARAGTNTRFSFGDDPNYTDIYSYGWFSNNSGSGTHEVKKLKPNPWGLYDMHGNVWEWTTSIYSGSFRVVRGGSWRDNPRHLRSANRYRDYPDGHGSDVGFRLVRTKI